MLQRETAIRMELKLGTLDYRHVSYVPALDPQLKSKYSNGNGPVLGYNGSQGVPSINTLSLPVPLPALRQGSNICLPGPAANQVHAAPNRLRTSFSKRSYPSALVQTSQTVVQNVLQRRK